VIDGKLTFGGDAAGRSLAEAKSSQGDAAGCNTGGSLGGGTASVSSLPARLPAPLLTDAAQSEAAQLWPLLVL